MTRKAGGNNRDAIVTTAQYLQATGAGELQRRRLDAYRLLVARIKCVPMSQIHLASNTARIAELERQLERVMAQASHAEDERADLQRCAATMKAVLEVHHQFEKFAAALGDSRASDERKAG